MRNSATLCPLPEPPCGLTDEPPLRWDPTISTSALEKDLLEKGLPLAIAPLFKHTIERLPYGVYTKSTHVALLDTWAATAKPNDQTLPALFVERLNAFGGYNTTSVDVWTWLALLRAHAAAPTAPLHIVLSWVTKASIPETKKALTARGCSATDVLRRSFVIASYDAKLSYGTATALRFPPHATSLCFADDVLAECVCATARGAIDYATAPLHQIPESWYGDVATLTDLDKTTRELALSLHPTFCGTTKELVATAHALIAAHEAQDHSAHSTTARY